MDLLVHPFLDGELIDEERARIEKHQATCERCRALVHHEATFRQNLRARLRPRPMHPQEVPSELRQRVVAALDRADKQGDGPARAIGRIAVPSLGALAVAAVIALLPNFTSRPSSDGGLAEAAIAGYQKNLPVEAGGSHAEVTSWLAGKVPVAFHVPDMRMVSDTTLVGVRLWHLASRDAGQIVYRVGRSKVSLYVFDAAGWDVPESTNRILRRVEGREVYVTQRAGYSVALYSDRGVGYALATDLDEDTLLALVRAALDEDSRK